MGFSGIFMLRYLVWWPDVAGCCRALHTGWTSSSVAVTDLGAETAGIGSSRQSLVSEPPQLTVPPAPCGVHRRPAAPGRVDHPAAGDATDAADAADDNLDQGDQDGVYDDQSIYTDNG
jgi:hypothetical protein